MHDVCFHTSVMIVKLQTAKKQTKKSVRIMDPEEKSIMGDSQQW